MNSLFNLYDTVIMIKSPFKELVNKIGKIIDIDEEVLIEFETPVSFGHSGHGMGKYLHCRWFNKDILYPNDHHYYIIELYNNDGIINF